MATIELAGAAQSMATIEPASPPILARAQLRLLRPQHPWRLSFHGFRSRSIIFRAAPRKIVAAQSNIGSAAPANPPPSPSGLIGFSLTMAPPPPLSDIVWPAAGSFVAMAVMGLLDKLIEPMGLTFTIAPFGAVCAVLFAAPNTPAARKYNMFVAHIGCATLGVVALAIFGPGWMARSVALAASVAFMQYTGSLHPPAAGLPLLFIDAPRFQPLQWWYMLFPGAAGCILLCLLQEVVLFLREKCRF